MGINSKNTSVIRFLLQQTKTAHPTIQFFYDPPLGSSSSTLDDPRYRMTPTPKKEFFRILVVLFLVLERQIQIYQPKKEARANNQHGKKSQAPTMCSPAAEAGGRKRLAARRSDANGRD